MTEEVRRLYRARNERMIGGVCGGLGKYLGMDPTVVRLLFVLGLFVFPGAIPGVILIYLALLLVVPEEPLSDGMQTGKTTTEAKQ
jgi:phage shock protein C